MSENQGQGRSHLKEYFETDKMPTEDHFAELIDSGLNKTDDQLSVADAGAGENSARFVGIGSTDPQSPLSIRNRTGDAKLIGLENAAGDEAWHISVNPPGSNNGLAVTNNNNPDAALMMGADGNVGIGTNTPGEKLDVNGNARVSNGDLDLTNGDLNMATGDLNLTVGNAGIGGDLAVTGNMGIGTDTPTEKLDVDGNVRVENGNLELTNGNLNLTAGSADITGDLTINGNTGIGTDTPGEKLDVNGNVRVANGNVELTDGNLNVATGNLSLNTGGANITGDLTINGNTGIGIDTPGEKLDINGNVRVSNGNVDLTDGNLNMVMGNLIIGNINIDGDSTGEDPVGEDPVGEDPAGEDPTGTLNERLIVNGNARFENSDITLTNGNLNLDTGGATIAGDLAVNGNMGIGTDNPAEKLDIDGNIRVTTGSMELTDGNLNIATGNLEITTGDVAIGSGLTVNGNTGIGTDTPIEKLEVDGNVRVTTGSVELTDGNLNLTTGSADIAGSLTVDGNTGIGAAPDPGFKLDVSGNLRASGNVTAQSFEGEIGWSNITSVPDVLQNFDGTVGWNSVTDIPTPIQNFDGTLAWDNVTAKPNSLIPTGAIIMWSGSAADVPDTWAICDGNNGTPNLKDRFIVSVGDNYTPGDTGGESEVTLAVDQLPAHDHPHDLAVQPGGAHSHVLNNEMGGAAGSGNQFNMIDEGSQGTLDTNTAGEHVHTISGGIGNTGGGQPHENRPPYYALVYIMKLQEELPEELPPI